MHRKKHKNISHKVYLILTRLERLELNIQLNLTLQLIKLKKTMGIAAESTLWSVLKITLFPVHFGSDALINGKFPCIKAGGYSISHSALSNKVIYCYSIHISPRFWQDYRFILLHGSQPSKSYCILHRPTVFFYPASVALFLCPWEYLKI